MNLADDRVDAYLRALAAGLRALAPAEDHVPGAVLHATLAALSTELSGTLLGPAGLHPLSGLPELPWLARALAEQRLARGEPEAADADRIARAKLLEPALGERMEQRERLREFLRQNALLNDVNIIVITRSYNPTIRAGVMLDYVSADGLFMRLRLEGDWARTSPGLRPSPAGPLEPGEGLLRLLSRHALDPLPALQELLERALQVRVTRLSRGALGPFWFPGVALPAGVPPPLGRGLLLHMASEVLLREELPPGALAHPSALGEPTKASPAPAICHDPLAKTLDAPPGWRLFQERRFSASFAVSPALHAWLRERGARCEVLPLVP